MDPAMRSCFSAANWQGLLLCALRGYTLNGEHLQWAKAHFFVGLSDLRKRGKWAERDGSKVQWLLTLNTFGK
jgi:hypothetical protein